MDLHSKGTEPRICKTLGFVFVGFCLKFLQQALKSWCTWPTSPGGHGPAPLEQSVCLFWSVTLSWISKRNANKKQKSAYYTRHQWINVDRMSFDWRLDFANSSKVVLFVTCANLSRSNETACQQEILSLIANWDDTPTRISDLEHLGPKRLAPLSLSYLTSPHSFSRPAAYMPNKYNFGLWSLCVPFLPP